MQQQREQMELYFQNRLLKNKSTFDSFFSDFENSLLNESYTSCIENMNSLATYLGKELKYKKFDDFDTAMKSEDPLIL
jgi:hypothetical protein